MISMDLRSQIELTAHLNIKEELHAELVGV